MKRWPTPASPRRDRCGGVPRSVRATRRAGPAALPLLLAQGLGAAAVLGLVAALVSWQWPSLVAAAGSWVLHPVAALDLGVAAWLGVVMAAVLGPLAIYAAVRE